MDAAAKKAWTDAHADELAAYGSALAAGRATPEPLPADPEDDDLAKVLHCLPFLCSDDWSAPAVLYGLIGRPCPTWARDLMTSGHCACVRCLPRQRKAAWLPCSSSSLAVAQIADTSITNASCAGGSDCSSGCCRKSSA